MHLVAPSAVSIHIVSLPPGEPRRPVGFIHPNDDGEPDEQETDPEA